MTVAMDVARREASGWKVYVLGAYYLVATNVSLSVAGFGLFQILLAIGLNVYFVGTGTADPMVEFLGIPLTGSGEGNRMVFSGFLGIWGTSLFIGGMGIYLTFWLNKLYGQAVSDSN